VKWPNFRWQEPCKHNPTFVLRNVTMDGRSHPSTLNEREYFTNLGKNSHHRWGCSKCHRRVCTCIPIWNGYVTGEVNNSVLWVADVNCL
jgi:hypothetical protein